MFCKCFLWKQLTWNFVSLPRASLTPTPKVSTPDMSFFTFFSKQNHCLQPMQYQLVFAPHSAHLCCILSTVLKGVPLHVPSRWIYLSGAERTVDFMHPTLAEHGTDNLVVRDLDAIEDDFDLFPDYAYNASSHHLCYDTDSATNNLSKQERFVEASKEPWYYFCSGGRSFFCWYHFQYRYVQEKVLRCFDG